MPKKLMPPRKVMDNLTRIHLTLEKMHAVERPGTKIMKLICITRDVEELLYDHCQRLRAFEIPGERP